MRTPYRYLPVISDAYRIARDVLRDVLYAGDGVACPVCQGRFRAWIGGPQGSCPRCGSSTRQKLMWLALEQDGRAFKGACTLLHLAPEPGLRARLRAVAGLGYMTADLSAPEADVHTDITHLVFGDARFDLVLCSHVLEHVADDGAAMGELYRVLRPGGTAFIQVPYNREGPTDEDATVTDPKERERRFGQFDHVRVYGTDFEQRLSAVGFRVRKVFCSERVSASDMARYGLWDDVIFLCDKPGGAG